MTATSSRSIWPLAAIVALGLALRLYRLDALGLAGNEDYLAIAVRGILESGLPEFPSGVVYPRGLPLAYLSAGLASLFGLSELTLRLPSAVMSTSAIVGVYLLGRRLLSTDVALVAALLVALSDWEVEVGRTARMYAMLSAGCLYCVWLFHRSTATAGRRNAAALTGLTAITCWVHQIAFALAVMYACFPLQFKPDRRRIRLWGWAIGLVVVSAAAYYAVSHHQYAVWDEVVEAARGAQWEEAPDRLQGEPIDAFSDRYLVPVRTLAHSYPVAFAGLTASAGLSLLLFGIAAWRRPSERLFCFALMLVVAALYAQQMTLALMVLAAFVLVGRVLEHQTYRSKSLKILSLIAVAGLGWLAFTLVVGAPGGIALKAAVKPLLGYPPNFVKLFFEHYPAFGAVALVATTVAVARYLRAGRVDGSGLAALLFFAPAVVLGFHPQSIGRVEPRYVSFLNPFFLLLVAFGMSWIGRRLWQAFERQPRLRLPALSVYALVLLLASGFGGLRPSLALVAAEYGLNEDIPDRRASGRYFHPDSAGLADFVANGYRPGDVVISMDILEFYAHFPHGDYQLSLFGKPDAEGWLGGRLIESAAELEQALDRHAGQTVWIALSANHLRRFEGDPRLDAILRGVEERAGEPAYRARDGLSAVYVVPSGDGSRSLSSSALMW